MQEEKSVATGLRTNRIFILDTNVLIHDAKSMFSFKGVVVGIPFIVLEELDTFKREGGEKGHNVREVIRQLDALRRRGHLADGVPLENGTQGSILRVYTNPQEIKHPSLRSRDIHDVKDNLILQTVANLTEDGNKVTLVTKDINVRIKADALGLEAEDYTKGTVQYDSFYKGWTKMAIPSRDLSTLSTDHLSSILKNEQIWPNQFFIFENDNNPKDFRLFRHLRGGSFKEVGPITLMHIFGPTSLNDPSA